MSSWTLAIAVVVSVTVLAPVTTAGPALTAFASGCAALALLGVLVAMGVAERHVRARARVAVVIGGLVLAAIVRPLASDAALAAWQAATPPAAQLPLRIATNLVVWTVALTVTAILTAHLRHLRMTNARLRSVNESVERLHEHQLAFARSARGLVETASSTLRAATDRLALGPAIVDDVRHLASDVIQQWSHRLAEHASLAVADAPPASRPRPRPARWAWQVPPIGVVPVLYSACVLPFAVRSVQVTDVIVGALAVAAGGLASDVSARRIRGTRTLRVATYLGMSAGVGLLLMALAMTQGVPGGLALITATGYTSLAVAASLCAGVVRALEVEQRRLSRALRAAQQAARIRTHDTRAALRDAALALHRDGQSRCLLFTAASRQPMRADLTRLQADLSELSQRVTRVFDGSGRRASVDDLTELLATWQPVLRLESAISPDAVRMLGASWQACDDAYEIVAEGLLNAMKHSRPARAEVAIEIVATGAGPRVCVEVRSPGPLTPGATLRPHSAARERGAHLRAEATGTVLEALLPVESARAVVSAEHPREHTTRES